MVASDAAAYFRICADPLVMKTYGVSPHRNTDETRRLIRQLAQGFRNLECLRWGIEDAGVLIGDIGFWRFVHVRARGELGGKILPAYWNTGVMTEAMAGVIDYSFSKLGLHSVEGNIEPANRGSHRLVEKLGFRKIGLIPGHSYSVTAKKYTDTVLYSLVASEWKKNKR